MRVTALTALPKGIPRYQQAHSRLLQPQPASAVTLSCGAT